MKIVGIIQARMGSTRLPGKVMKLIEGKPILEHLIERLNKTKNMDSTVIATSNLSKDREIVVFAKKRGIKFFTGSVEDVLSRYYNVAKRDEADIIVRICADSPLADPWEIDKMIEHHIKKKADYTHNKHDKGPPFGTGAEVISFDALERAYLLGKEPCYREHVTLFIKEQPSMFKIEVVDAPKSIRFPSIRLVVDYEEDLKLVREIYKELYKNKRIFKLDEVIKLLNNNPELRKINAHIPNK